MEARLFGAASVAEGGAASANGTPNKNGKRMFVHTKDIGTSTGLTPEKILWENYQPGREILGVRVLACFSLLCSALPLYVDIIVVGRCTVFVIMFIYIGQLLGTRGLNPIMLVHIGLSR